MASRKPVVLNNGEFEQLQAGDTLNATVSEVDAISLTNGDAGAHALGDAVYISAADTAMLALADAAGTKSAVALALGAVSAAAVGNYQLDGVIVGLSGLTPGAVYYLSDTVPGGMSTTPPSTTGRFVVRLGIAKSATEFLIRIERAVKL